MPNLHATPARRLRHCQIIERSWPVPTLRAFPAPPFVDSQSFVPRSPLQQAQPTAYRARSRSYRKMHDCQFLPDMDVAFQILNARRATEATPSSHEPQRSTFQMAVAIGLLMTIAPPVAVTLVWATPTFSRAGQLALTVYGALVTLVFAAIAITAIV